jgi:periplasmic protein CpxP/Spy
METLKTGMKFFVLMAIFFASSNLKAQENESMEKRKEMAEHRFKELSERLKLTPEQQTKFRAIAKENRMEMKQLRESKKDAPKEERKAAAMAQFKKANDQINAILTPKQLELFTQYKAEKKSEREKKMKEKHQENEMMEEMKLF